MTSRTTLMRSRWMPLLAAALLAVPLPLAATSVVLGSDAELADQAPLVVDATVLAEEPAPVAPRSPATDYRVRVERVLKGRLPAEDAGSLRLRVLGGPGPDGLTLKIWGAPVLRAGERVLLFLVPPAEGSEGAYRPLHLSVGVFHQLLAEAGEPGRPLAARDLSEMTLVDDGGGLAPGEVQVRDHDRFAEWLADRAAGVERAPDYELQLPAAVLDEVRQKFTYLQNLKQRWVQFDRGTPVGWTMSQAGQPGLADGGFNEFQAAIEAWDANQGTDIRYRYDGASSYSGGFTRSDGHNTLLTEDPNDDLPGRFVCTFPGTGSGILAAGGTWIPRGVPPPVPIREADIVTQDGVGCWFNHDPARAEQVMAHELGHTLGLGHSCGDDLSGPCDTFAKNDALMRATAHNDDRGASIRADDRAGIATLYPAGGGSGSGSGSGHPPAAPSRLVAAALSSGSIVLAWQDNSRNATRIVVEIRRGGGSYRQILTLGAAAAAATVTGLAAATRYSFRVRAHNGSGFSPYSNEATATTLPAVAAAAATPGELTPAPEAGGQIAPAAPAPPPWR
jgi:Fibronectin type III domain/Matrixin